MSGHVSFNPPSEALTNRSVLLRALHKFHTSGLRAEASRPETKRSIHVSIDRDCCKTDVGGVNDKKRQEG